jgi:putative addiction module component (TIGR02574 family)
MAGSGIVEMTLTTHSSPEGVRIDGREADRTLPKTASREPPHGARLSCMNTRVEHILDEALALASEERSALVIALFESLESSADPAISDAWREEILRRRAALRAGASQPAPWSEARARLLSL